MSQALEAVVEAGSFGLAGLGPLNVFTFLSQQVENSHAEPAPVPKLTRLRMSLMSVVPKIFYHRRPFFMQRCGESLIEVIVWGYAVGDGLRFGKQDVTRDFVDHCFLS